MKISLLSILTLAIGSGASAAASPPTAARECETRLYEKSRAEYCGALAVPVDHFAEAKTALMVPYRRIASVHPDADNRPTILWFNGGPGLSNMGGAPLSEFLNRFNILIVGYRGVDTPPDISCPEIEAAITSARRILGDGVEAMKKAIGRCIDQLESRGYEPRHFTVLQTIHDAKYVQDALGIDRVHIVAGSFGARLGLIYQEAFPEDVARSVFIGANPPGRTVWTPQSIDAVLSRIAALCAIPEACRASPYETLAALRHRDTEGLRLLGVKFDDERARVAAFLLAYDANNLPLVVDAFMDASRGDRTGLWLLSVAHDPAVRASGISWGHFVLMGAAADYETDRDYARDLAPSPAAPFGSPLAALLWSAIAAAGLQQIDEENSRLSARDHPTLLISGDLDLSAPYEQIEKEIMPYRPNAVHWVTPNAGHYNLYGRELMSAAAEFLQDVAVRPPESRRSLRLKPVLGLSDMARIGVAAALVVFFLMFFLIRRMLADRR